MNISQKFENIMQRKKFDKEDIFFIVQNFYAGKLNENQMSKFLWFVFDNNFTSRQTFNLTNAMMSKGQTLDLSHFNLSVDKHSTGGVSDSTTLIVVPLFALLGFQCYKMSGGALGHTGGTADKMKVFKNINIELPVETAFQIINKTGGCFVSQTLDIAPIDKKIYALRDKIGAVDNVSLIASSIMSKKLAVGCKHIVLDVKYGNGALIKDKQKAKQLAKLMCDIGKFYGREVKYVMGDMREPLGNAIGDYYEVMEVLNLLKNYKPCKLTNHSINLVCQFASQIGLDKKTCKQKCISFLKDGSAYNKLEQIVNLQGGTMPEIVNLKNLQGITILSNKQGVLNQIQTQNLGNFFHKNKNIKGALVLKRLNNKIKKGDGLIKIFAENLSQTQKNQLINMFEIQ